MDNRLIVGLVAGVLLLGVMYYEASLDAEDSSLPAASAQGPEALVWLRRNHSESALAGNRFEDTRDAISFVQQLYRAGAVRVVVPQESIQADGEEKYADAVVVTLPEDAAKRDQVWKLCARELAREGAEPPDSTTEKLVLLWWD